MTNTAIEQAGKLLDSPLAGIVANACGANINNVRSALAKLTNKTSTGRRNADPYFIRKEGYYVTGIFRKYQYSK